MSNWAEPFFNSLGKFVSSHFKGGVLWLYAIGGGVVLVMFGYIKFLEADNRKLKVQRDNAIAESMAKGAVVNSQIRTQTRRVEAEKDLENIEDEITNSPNPIEFSYNWLRDHRARQADNSPD